MRVAIDLIEGGASHEAILPDPSSLSVDGDVVSFQLREVGIRMTIMQFIGFIDICKKWSFRGMHGGDSEGKQDLNEDFIPAAEHERLRFFIRKMLDEHVVGGADVPDAVRWALSHALREEHIDVSEWRDQEETILALKHENQQLRDQLAMIKDVRRAGRNAAPKERA